MPKSIRRRRRLVARGLTHAVALMQAPVTARLCRSATTNVPSFRARQPTEVRGTFATVAS